MAEGNELNLGRIEMRITGEDAEVLYPLESLIVSVARANPSLLDLHVLDALELLRRSFVAESQQRKFGAPRTEERTYELFMGLRAVGEFLLGRSSANLDVEMDRRPEPISIERLVACIKKLEKSAKFWNEEGGRQGYLAYINEYLPR